MYRHLSRGPNLAPLAIIATLLLLIFFSLRSQSQRTYAPLSAYFDLAQANVPVNQITPLPAAQAQIIEQSPLDWRTEQLEIVLELDAYREQLPTLASELQLALDYVQERLGLRLTEPVRIIITPDDQCGFHGITYSDVRIIYVYTCASTPVQRIVNLAAHEYVHQLAQDRYAAQHLQADLILSEGLATWGAGSYWLGGYGSFRDFIRSYLATHQQLPLDTHYRDVDSIAAMNTLYYEWASFVEFLIEVYGRERFDQVYASGGNQEPGMANYDQVYQQSFEDLAIEWATWIQ